MLTPGTRGVRARVAALAEDHTPAPRAAFVADLEQRLNEVMHAATRGDLLPEIELAPPAPPRSRHLPTLSLVAMIALVVAIVGATLGAVTPVAQDLRLAGDARVPATEPAGPRPGDRSAPFDRDDPAAAPTRPPAAATGTTSTDRVPGAEGATASAAPAATPTAKGAGELEMRATGTPARVTLGWTPYLGDEFGAYLVLRSASPDDVDHPDPSGRSQLLLRIENRDMVAHEDAPRLGTTPRYRVVVVDRSGAVVARSAVAMPWQPFDPTLTRVGVLP